MSKKINKRMVAGIILVVIGSLLAGSGLIEKYCK